MFSHFLVMLGVVKDTQKVVSMMPALQSSQKRSMVSPLSRYKTRVRPPETGSHILVSTRKIFPTLVSYKPTSSSVARSVQGLSDDLTIFAKVDLDPWLSGSIISMKTLCYCIGPWVGGGEDTRTWIQATILSISG